MEKLSTPESRIDEVWILSIASRKSAAILRMSITCSAKISPRISIPLVVNWSKRWWSSKPDKTTSSDKRSSKRSHVGRGRNRSVSMFRRKVCVVSSVVVVFSLVLILLLHVAAAVAVVPRGSCVFLSYKRLLGQPTDCDLESGSSKSISVLGRCLRFASFPLPLRLSLSLSPLPLSSSSSSSSPLITFSQHHHHHHQYYFILSLFSDFSLFGSCFS